MNVPEKASESYDKASFFTGLALAILSTVFIGSSFIIKKKALIKINNQGNLRAGAGGFGYLREWMWWGGFISSKFNNTSSIYIIEVHMLTMMMKITFIHVTYHL